MNPNGPSQDPTDEDLAIQSEASSTIGAASEDENKTVSPTATSGKNGADSAAALAPQAKQKSEKVREQQTEKSGLAAMLQFLTEVLIELKKITWPDRQQVIKETLSVIVLVAIITACVLAFDYGIAKVVFEPLDKLARHLGGGIGVHH